MLLRHARLLPAIAFAVLCSAAAATVLDEWVTVPVPPPPKLQPVTLDRASTALLLLDFNKQSCNVERRPRCIASLRTVQALLTLARSRGLTIVYSISTGAKAADIAGELAPRDTDPVVAGPPDKFLDTELEAILRSQGIKTVIVAGTVANGAVLYTASGAAFRGIDVVIPLDTVSAESLYAEQFAAWQMVNGPRLADRVKLTTLALLHFF
jgi:nicotinamidase-related amidase